MKVLRLFWHILVVLFQESKILWKKYQAYRALKAQQPDEQGTQVGAAPSQEKVAIPSSDSTKSPAPIETPSAKPPPSKSSASVETKRISHKTKTVVQTDIPLVEVGADLESQGDPNLRWVTPGTAAQIQGRLIADGFIYLGRHPSDSAETPPSLIDPSLPIKTPAIDQRADILAMDWFQDGALSYAILSPEMRAVFLGWLATGRKERDISVSALLLFLLGIEHRVIELLSGDRTVDELLALILELERLEVHYAHHSSVVPLIQRLTECCQVQLALSCQPETLLALLPMGQKLSMALKVALGQCIQEFKPIPMTLLWAWYQSSSVAVDLKTPAKRCERAFNFLIQTRGEQREFTIEPGEKPPLLSVTYRPFRSYGDDTLAAMTVVETIDITELESQLTALEPLIEDCTNDLDAYSRLIGRSPESEGTPTAVALLPQELVFLSGNEQCKAIQTWCQQALATHDMVPSPGQALLSLWPTATPGKIRKKEAELLGLFLAKFGFGYVPDTRYGQATFNPKHPVILFRLAQMGMESLSADYPVALSLVELAPFFDGVSDQRDPVPFDKLVLTDSERLRLAALGQWRTEVPLTWKKACARVSKLSPEAKFQLAIELNLLLERHWQLDDTKYTELQSIIPLPERADSDTDAIAQDTAPLNSEAHSLANTVTRTEADDYVVPKETQLKPEQDGAPETTEPARPVFTLDTRLIAQRSQESHVASGLLSDIFEDDDPAEAQKPSPPTHPSNFSEVSQTLESPEITSLALGLDEFHWHLLQEIGQRDSWERSELEAIAQDQGLLLDGALENINDVAFDHCDEALTEGDDPIEVNDWVYEELQAA